MPRQEKLSLKELILGGNLKRKDRSNKLLKEQSALVHNFNFEKASCSMPNKNRSVVHKNNENGAKVSM